MHSPCDVRYSRTARDPVRCSPFPADTVSNVQRRTHRPRPAQGPGPKRVLAGMESLLRDVDQRGLLRIEQPLQAAEHFFCLVKGAPDYRLLIGYAPPLQGDAAEAHVQEAVGVFARAYRQ